MEKELVVENESIQSSNNKKKRILSETAVIKIEERLPEGQIKVKLKQIDFPQHKKIKKKSDSLISQKNNHDFVEGENIESLPCIFRNALKITKKSLSSAVNGEIKKNLVYQNIDTDLCATTQKTKKYSLIHLINDENENYIIPIIGYMIFCKMHSFFSFASNNPKQRINLIIKDTSIEEEFMEFISLLADSFNFKFATDSDSKSFGFSSKIEDVKKFFDEEKNNETCCKMKLN